MQVPMLLFLSFVRYGRASTNKKSPPCFVQTQGELPFNLAVPPDFARHAFDEKGAMPHLRSSGRTRLA